jgi:phage shock protein A
MLAGDRGARVGLIDWFHHRFQQTAEDPLAAFDQRLAALDQRGAQLRKAVATLFLARRDLEELCAQALALGHHLLRQMQEAERCEDAALCARLAADRAQALARGCDLDADLARIDEEAAVLKASSEQVGKAAEALRGERANAAIRLEATKGFQETARAIEPAGEALALGHPRDEVERASALAELSREDLEAGRKPN